MRTGLRVAGSSLGLRRMMRVAGTSLLSAALLPAAAWAQDASLEAVERLAATGRLTDARTTLDRWNRQHPESSAVPGDERAHALLLTARLATDPEAAQAAYMGLALGYPTSRHAPEALLRLGQALVLAAEAGTSRDGAARAVGFLQRLTADYPANPHREVGQLWLVRALAAAGQPDRACLTARNAIEADIQDPEVDDILRVEYAGLCERNDR